MIRRHLHNRIYLIPGILHMMTSLCFMIYCIRHFHSNTFIVFPLLALIFCILILPGAILSIVIGVFYCNARQMYKLKKIQMAFAIISASVHGVCLLALAVLIFMGTFDVETMILLVLFEFVLAVVSSTFLKCFSAVKKDQEEGSPYKPARKNSFMITRPTVNEVPHLDQFSNSKTIPYRHTYASDNVNGEQSSPSIEELPDSPNGHCRDVFSSQSFHGKPSTPQIEKFTNGHKFPRPGGLRVQNLRQCSVNIDEYPSAQNFPQYTHTEVLINQNNYTGQGIINIGGTYQNQKAYTGQHYPSIQEFQDNQEQYNMRCAHFIGDSYSENGHCDQCYLHGESMSSQQDYYMQDMPNDTEDSASNSASNTDKQSDLYPTNTEDD